MGLVQKLLLPLSEAGSLEAVSLVLRSSRRASSSEKPRGVSPGGEATGDKINQEKIPGARRLRHGQLLKNYRIFWIYKYIAGVHVSSACLLLVRLWYDEG